MNLFDFLYLFLHILHTALEIVLGAIQILPILGTYHMNQPITEYLSVITYLFDVVAGANVDDKVVEVLYPPGHVHTAGQWYQYLPVLPIGLK